MGKAVRLLNAALLVNANLEIPLYFYAHLSEILSSAKFAILLFFYMSFIRFIAFFQPPLTSEISFLGGQ